MSTPTQQGLGSYRSSQLEEEDDFSYDDDDDYDSVLHGDHVEEDDDDDDEAVLHRNESSRSEDRQENELTRTMAALNASQHTAILEPTAISEAQRALVMSAGEGGGGGFHTATVLPGPFVVLQGIPGDGMRNTIDSMPALLADGRELTIGGVSDHDRVGEMSRGSPESGAIDVARSFGGLSLSDQSGQGTVPMGSEEDVQLQHCRRRREGASSVSGELLASSSSRPQPGRTSSASDDFVAVQTEHQAEDRGQDTRLGATQSSAQGATSTSGASRALGLANVLPVSGTHSRLLLSPVTASAAAIESFVVVPTDDTSAGHNSPEPHADRRRNRTARPPSFPRRSSSLRSLSQQGTPRRFRGVNLTDDERRSIRRWSDECRERELRNLLELGPPTSIPDASQSSASLSSALSLDHQQQHHLRLLLRQRWWQRNGLLAVFREVPVVLTSSGAVDGEVVGALSPGCTIMATECLTLDSQSLVRLDERTVRERLRGRGGRRGGGMVGGGGRGLCQVLRVESPRVGYVVFSLDGYPFLGPGLPSYYTEPNIWTWRVTCHEGAFIRDGLELTSAHVDTVPYGSFLRVTRKTINSMGLSRLRVEAALDGNEDNDIADDNGRRQSRRSVLQQATTRAASLNSSTVVGLDILSNRPGVLSGSKVRVTAGWISEELNPLSGQRGPVVQSVPFPVPALYRVTLDEGAVIRSDVELSSSQIGHAPAGTVLTVVGRAYSQHPMDQCIERLRLAGGGGWISVRLNRPPPMDQLVVEMVGIDGSFDPDEPGFFHLDAQRRVLEEFRERNQSTQPDGMESVVASLQQRRPTEGVSEEENGVDMDVGTTQIRSEASADERASDSEPSTSLDGAPSSLSFVRRSGVAGDGNRVGSKGASHRPNEDDKCLICLTEPRTATIVHGETGHVACCLTCARILKARGDRCPVCRLRIDSVIQQFWA